MDIAPLPENYMPEEEEVTLRSYKTNGRRKEHVEIELAYSNVTFFVANGRTTLRKNPIADLSDKRLDSVKDVFVSRRYRNCSIEEGMQQVFSLLLRYFYIECVIILTNDDGEDIQEQWLKVAGDCFTLTGVKCYHVFANRIMPGLFQLMNSIGAKGVTLSTIKPETLVSTVKESGSHGFDTMVVINLEENGKCLQSLATLLKKWEAKEISFSNVEVIAIDDSRNLTDKIVADSLVTAMKHTTEVETETTIHDIDTVEETRSTRILLERHIDKLLLFVTLDFMPEYTQIALKEPHR